MPSVKRHYGHSARHLLLAVFIALLSACKIVQIVPDGGRIASQSGLYDCEAGQTCILDVPEGSSFYEEFTAQPEPGFVFQGWQKSPGFLCGGERSPCTLESDGSLPTAGVVTYLKPVFEPTGLAPITIEMTDSRVKMTLFPSSTRDSDYRALDAFFGDQPTPIAQAEPETYIGYSHIDQESIVAATRYPNGDFRISIQSRGDGSQILPPGSDDEYASTSGNARIVPASASEPPYQRYRALGKFYPGRPITNRESPLAIILDVTKYQRLGIYNTQTMLEKAHTSINVMDAQYQRDLGLSHPLHRLVLSDAPPDESFWPQSDAQLRLWFDEVAANRYAVMTEINGGLANVCGLHSINTPTVQSNYGLGEFWWIFRHEVGHNHGSGHGEGHPGGIFDNKYRPDGESIMLGNSPERGGRINGFEVDAMERCLRDPNYNPFLRSVPAPHYSVPPYAKFDDVFFQDPVNALRIDVMANDHDSNGDFIAIADFTPRTARGRVVLRPGNGVDQRDALVYRFDPNIQWGEGDEDSFEYKIIDDNGRVATGRVRITKGRRTFSSALNQAELERMTANVDVMRDEYFSRYDNVLVTTHNGAWVRDTTLPQIGISNAKEFTLSVQSTRFVSLHYSGQTMHISEGSTVTLRFEAGQWEITEATIEHPFTIFDGPELTLALASPEAIANQYRLYRNIAITTQDYAWVSNIRLPTSGPREGDTFSLDVQSTNPVVLHYNNRAITVFSGNGVSLTFGPNGWQP